MARRRFFVSEIRAGHARIEGDDAHHLTRVLRVEVGQKYEISDNHTVYLARVETARKNLVEFSVMDPLPEAASGAQIRLYPALIRFERFEWLIEKATELGVESIVPLVAERSETGLEQAAVKRAERWKRIVREASEQSRRVRLTEMGMPVRIPEALRDAARFRYLLDEAGGEPLVSALVELENLQGEFAFMLGPEGGWTDRERAAIIEAGWRPISLGPQILKTETAAIAACAILNAVWWRKAL